MNFLKKLSLQSEFLNNVLKLSSSSAFASVITALALPVITRLYTEQDIGNYQLLYSIVLPFGLVASLKYEMAIVLPKDEDDSNNLIIVSFLVLLITSLLLFSILSFFERPVLNFLEAEQLTGYAIFIIVGIFFTGLLQVCRFILIRFKRFGDLAKNKIYQMASNQGIAIGWGFYNPTFVGLFMGYIFGVIIPVIVVFSKRLFNIRQFNWLRAKELMIEFKKFPLLNTASIFLNNFSLQLPVFMFSKFYTPEIIGLYAIANQALVMPTITVIGTSVQQVYYQAASEAYNKDPGELMSIYLQTIKKLGLIGLIPIIGVIIFAPLLAGIVFGSKWAVAGTYMQILSIGIYFRLMNSPIAATLSVINRQEAALILIIISIVIRFGAMYIFRATPIMMLWALSISTAVFYALFNFSVYFFIRRLLQEK